MNRALSGIPVIVALIALTSGGTSYVDTATGSDADVIRLRAHFETVERELAARDISQLSPAQRAARQRHIEVLREYARAGVFPHNHHFSTQTPYFKDEHATLCAMAYLIARSGRADLVAKVARSANNAYLPALARDPELRAWLDENGLTVAEAARIQPAYEPTPAEEADASYEIASIAAAVVSGGAITWTLLSNPRRAGYTPGLITSVIGLGDLLIAAGGALSDMDGGMSESEEHLTALNALIGTATFVAGVTYIVRVANARSKGSATESPASQHSKWQPLLTNDVSGRARIGVVVRF